MIRQWHIGDGSLCRGERGNPYIVLCSDSFPIKDIEWMIKQLKKLGFKATRSLSNNRIRISSYSTKAFLDYIGSSPVRCYNYKFDY